MFLSGRRVGEYVLGRRPEQVGERWLLLLAVRVYVRASV